MARAAMPLPACVCMSIPLPMFSSLCVIVGKREASSKTAGDHLALVGHHSEHCRRISSHDHVRCHSTQGINPTPNYVHDKPKL